MLDVLVVGAVFREAFEDAAGRTSRVRLGGSAYTAAAAAARLGARVGLAALVGSTDSAFVREELEPLGIDCDTLVETEGSSGVFLVDDDRGAPRPGFRPPAPLLLPLPDLPAARVVLVFGVPGFDVSLWLATADLSDVTVIWDRQGWLSLNDAASVASIEAGQRFYLANLSEAVGELNAAGPDELRSLLPPAGFEVAVIKDGCWGVSVVGETTSFEVPAFHVTLTSEIGSGDAFAGVLAAGVAAGMLLQDAALQAASAAAIVIESGNNVLPAEVADVIARLKEAGRASRVLPHERRALTLAIETPPTASGALAERELLRLLAPLGLRIVANGESADIVVTMDADPTSHGAVVVVPSSDDPAAVDRSLRAARDQVVSWVREQCALRPE